MTDVRVLAALLVLPLLAPLAAAAPPLCAAVTASTPMIPVDESYAEPRLAGSALAVEWWNETNGVAGLQKQACVADSGATVAADGRGPTNRVDASGVVGLLGDCIRLFGSTLLCVV